MYTYSPNSTPHLILDPKPRTKLKINSKNTY